MHIKLRVHPDPAVLVSLVPLGASFAKGHPEVLHKLLT